MPGGFDGKTLSKMVRIAIYFSAFTLLVYPGTLTFSTAIILVPSMMYFLMEISGG